MYAQSQCKTGNVHSVSKQNWQCTVSLTTVHTWSECKAGNVQSVWPQYTPDLKAKLAMYTQSDHSTHLIWMQSWQCTLSLTTVHTWSECKAGNVHSVWPQYTPDLNAKLAMYTWSNHITVNRKCSQCLSSAQQKSAWAYTTELIIPHFTAGLQ